MTMEQPPHLVLVILKCQRYVIFQNTERLNLLLLERHVLVIILSKPSLSLPQYQTSDYLLWEL